MNQLHLFLAVSSPATVCYDGTGINVSNDPYVPEQWALESLRILEESMVMSRLVHRDFNPIVQSFGDVINTRRPRKFGIERKTDADCVVDSPTQSDNVQVKLNQHFYKSFIIKDGEASLSFMDLMGTYLAPAVQAIGRGVDRAVAGHAHMFLGNRVGRLSDLPAADTQNRLVELSEIFDENEAGSEGRHLVICPSTKSAMLQNPKFTCVNEAGDGGDALRRAMIAQLFGFSIYNATNIPNVSDVNIDVDTAGTMTAAIVAGDAPVASAFAGATNVPVAGQFFVVEGNGQPNWATAAGAGTVTPNEAFVYDTPAGAKIKLYVPVTADVAYADCYSMHITVAGHAAGKAPRAKQMLAIGATPATRKVYTIIDSKPNAADPTKQDILLDRPLEGALAAGDTLFPGPAGCFNLAFQRDALALVTRPLALPPSNSGVLASVQSYNDLGLRITMQYDSKCQGTRVTVDTLAGIALLNEELGALLLG